MAASAYLFVFLIYLFMILSGFILYTPYMPRSLPGIVSGWFTLPVPGPWWRFAHHVTMWFLICFIINHIYSGWLFDIRCRGGVISGMFSGYKLVRD
jgi:Ni/Fe-hydrogenase 1 B-type cytochrome subunit